MNRIYELLIFLGLAPERKGFHYLECLIEEFLSNPNMTLKEAYKKIASIVNANEYTIDSSIRNVIHSAYDSGKLLRLNQKMNFEIIDNKYCPTNKALISYLVRYLKSIRVDVNIQCGQAVS